MPKFQIPGRLPSLNSTDRDFKNPYNRFKGGRTRKMLKLFVAGYIWDAKLPKFTTPVKIEILWVEKDRRRDFDNIGAGVKIILDALVATERIRGDSQRWLRPVQHHFAIDKENPRIEITITETTDAF